MATVPEFRGRGLAATLVSLGRDDFSRLGGELLGLGTVNPAAARVYRKAGFHRLGGCDAWYCNVRDSRTPEEYLVDSFRAARAAGPPRYVNGTGDAWPCLVAEGTAAERVSAMALVHWVGASDDLLLDHNLELFSPRMETITSAMGVYNRYEAMREVFGGTWVTAHAPDGTLVGLATCMPGGGGPGSGDDEECCWVDAHIHRSFLGDWGALLGGATGWASAQRRFTRVAVRVAAEDDAKRQRFARHGFRPAGPDAAGGRALSLPLAHSVGGEDRQVELVYKFKNGNGDIVMNVPQGCCTFVADRMGRVLAIYTEQVGGKLSLMPAELEHVQPYLRFRGLTTNPFRMALVETFTRTACPSMTARTRCRFGLIFRFETPEIFRPMPPLYLGRPR